MFQRASWVGQFAAQAWRPWVAERVLWPAKSRAAPAMTWGSFTREVPPFPRAPNCNAEWRRMHGSEEFAVKIASMDLEADKLRTFISGGAPPWGMVFVLQNRRFVATP